MLTLQPGGYLRRGPRRTLGQLKKRIAAERINQEL